MGLVLKMDRTMLLFFLFSLVLSFRGPLIEKKITTSNNTSSTEWSGYGALPSPPFASVQSLITSADRSIRKLIRVFFQQITSA